MKRVFLMMLAYVLLLGNTYAQWNLSIIVKNDKGNVLEGATVIIKDSNLQSITDLKGESKLRLSPGTYLLQVSYLGYQTYEEKILLNSDKHLDITLHETSFASEEIVIKGVRAANNQPATFTIIQKEDVDKQNLGQDMPYLLALEPSVVTTSDAGTGIGYTSMRIRGLDSRKVNVTINGIPYNDPESHGTYWVDIPDIASSVSSIQLQRGLGKSAAGPAAFGASINIETNKIPQERYVKLDNSVGSFNTMKNTIQLGTGLLKNHWFGEGRFSRIVSDGYIDRATSTLRSYFAQAGYYDTKSIFRLIAFGGYEETYQAWYGIDSAGMQSLGRTYNYAGYYTRNGNENFYDKQVDHYNQNHFQANYIHSFSSKLQFNAILNYTYGKGYYQEYYNDVAYADYLFPQSDTADLVGRKWLDNQLVAGNTFVSWNSGSMSVTSGISFSRYFNAKHFGEILWGEALNSDLRHRFYENEGNKTDVSPYVKFNYQFLRNGNFYLDINYRYINYKAKGIDREFGDELPIDLSKTYNFFNPILGISYQVPKIGLAYVVTGVSHREPTRSDYINNYFIPGGPRPERLYNTEVGLRRVRPTFFYELNFYYMLYKDELVKTGQLDDVGSPVVRNAGESHRSGVELYAGVTPVSYLSIRGNVAFSRNKTDFRDYTGNKWITHENVDISFSPDVIAGGELTYRPIKYIELSYISKYVGEQYLDNTQDERRKLNDYFVNNVRILGKFNYDFLKNIEVKFLVNNLFDAKYNSNGYMYGNTPYYYPQAMRHYLLGLTLQF